MNDQPTFEQALQQLETVVSQLEKGSMPLDEALSCFEQGVQSAKLCRQLLQQAETQVEVLARQADGEFGTQSFSEPSDKES